MPNDPVWCSTDVSELKCETVNLQNPPVRVWKSVCLCQGKHIWHDRFNFFLWAGLAKAAGKLPK